MLRGLTRQIDAADTPGQRTTDNAAGVIIRQIDPDGKTTAYEYDTHGRLQAIIDGNGNEIVHYYDTNGTAGCSACAGSSAGQPSRIEYPTFARELRYDSLSTPYCRSAREFPFFDITEG
ncbi:RHS repeat domain-containing protein [Desulfatitalea alkaliphila]|uniref:RHS repeat protein n=1 Tax=Desulfatitalea alkaliphila TaxID=2929485 RepID=A0AA41UM98_9BACT|nr:RHS repeat domain-containing protein [Desulfatitalea alkaliphila]MCJ8503202.1 RHS repeat protein [Desulfatitalea alkaliphila]